MSTTDVKAIACDHGSDGSERGEEKCQIPPQRNFFVRFLDYVVSIGVLKVDALSSLAFVSSSNLLDRSFDLRKVEECDPHQCRCAGCVVEEH